MDGRRRGGAHSVAAAAIAVASAFVSTITTTADAQYVPATGAITVAVPAGIASPSSAGGVGGGGGISFPIEGNHRAFTDAFLACATSENSTITASTTTPSAFDVVIEQRRGAGKDKDEAPTATPPSLCDGSDGYDRCVRVTSHSGSRNEESLSRPSVGLSITCQSGSPQSSSASSASPSSFAVANFTLQSALDEKTLVECESSVHMVGAGEGGSGYVAFRIGASVPSMEPSALASTVSSFAVLSPQAEFARLFESRKETAAAARRSLRSQDEDGVQEEGVGEQTPVNITSARSTTTSSAAAVVTEGATLLPTNPTEASSNASVAAATTSGAKRVDEAEGEGKVNDDASANRTYMSAVPLKDGVDAKGDGNQTTLIPSHDDSQTNDGNATALGIQPIGGEEAAATNSTAASGTLRPQPTITATAGTAPPSALVFYFCGSSATFDAVMRSSPPSTSTSTTAAVAPAGCALASAATLADGGAVRNGFFIVRRDALLKAIDAAAAVAASSGASSALTLAYSATTRSGLTGRGTVVFQRGAEADEGASVPAGSSLFPSRNGAVVSLPRSATPFTLDGLISIASSGKEEKKGAPLIAAIVGTGAHSACGVRVAATTSSSVTLATNAAYSAAGEGENDNSDGAATAALPSLILTLRRSANGEIVGMVPLRTVRPAAAGAASNTTTIATTAALPVTENTTVPDAAAANVTVATVSDETPTSSNNVTATAANLTTSTANTTVAADNSGDDEGSNATVSLLPSPPPAVTSTTGPSTMTSMTSATTETEASTAAPTTAAPTKNDDDDDDEYGGGGYGNDENWEWNDDDKGGDDEDGDGEDGEARPPTTVKPKPTSDEEDGEKVPPKKDDANDAPAKPLKTTATAQPLPPPPHHNSNSNEAPEQATAAKAFSSLLTIVFIAVPLACLFYFRREVIELVKRLRGDDPNGAERVGLGGGGSGDGASSRRRRGGGGEHGALTVDRGGIDSEGSSDEDDDENGCRGQSIPMQMIKSSINTNGSPKILNTNSNVDFNGNNAPPVAVTIPSSSHFAPSAKIGGVMKPGKFGAAKKSDDASNNTTATAPPLSTLGRIGSLGGGLGGIKKASSKGLFDDVPTAIVSSTGNTATASSAAAAVSSNNVGWDDDDDFFGGDTTATAVKKVTAITKPSLSPSTSAPAAVAVAVTAVPKFTRRAESLGNSVSDANNGSASAAPPAMKGGLGGLKLGGSSVGRPMGGSRGSSAVPPSSSDAASTTRVAATRIGGLGLGGGGGAARASASAPPPPPPTIPAPPAATATSTGWDDDDDFE